MIKLTYRERIHSALHFIALAGTASGLSFSKAVMSLALVLGSFNLIAAGNYKQVISRLRSNRSFWLLSILFALHVVGLLWSSDLSYGLNDIRVKAPLILLPILIFSRPIEKESIHQLIFIFLATLGLVSIFNYLSYEGIVGNKEYNDIRGMSLFSSHIRFGLLVALGAMFHLYFLLRSKRFRALHLMMIIWFCYYTYFSQIISGNLALLAGIAAVLFYEIYQRNRKAAFLFGVVSIATPFLLLVAILSSEPAHVPVDPSTLPEFTREGNYYTHDLIEARDTRGNLIFINMCEEELRREWTKRSAIDYDGVDIKGQPIRTTLLRYMTSKQLMKDAEGFEKLSDKDISNIENGIAEIGDGKRGLMARMNGIRYQLHNAGDPNGHSLLQRVEHFKTGIQILSKNWLLGVGTGDVQRVFDEQYKMNKSLLNEENRNRAHNQLLTFWITFGIAGFALFLFILFTFGKQVLHSNNLPGFIFIIIAGFSCLLEDTLETQMGVTFFAFFYTLLIGYSDPKKDSHPLT